MSNANDVHLDGPLSTFISGYTNGDYIADTVAPIIEVDHRSDSYRKYKLSDWTTEQSDRIATDGEANDVPYAIEVDNYSVTDRALRRLVTVDEVANADDPQKPREYAAKLVMNKLLLSREIRVANLLLTAGNYAAANTTNGSNWFSDAGTPLEDVAAAIEAIPPSMIGDSKLVGVGGLEIGNALRRHADLRGPGSENRVETMSRIAEILGLDEIFIGTAIKNTANPGQAVSHERVWGDDSFAIVRVPTGEPVNEVGLFAATFRFTASMPVQARVYDAPHKGPRGGEYVQVAFSDDEKTVQDDMGFLLTGLDA
tara:strand:- start:450 stop:1385 length:936 start_codon:yes stop_codon:yes gene_type:complete